MIRFACPKCHKGFQVEDKLAGRKVKCPGCDGAISIPVPAPRPKAAPYGPPASPASPRKPVQAALAVVAAGGNAGNGAQSGSPQFPSQSAAAEDSPSGLSSETKFLIGVFGAFSVVVAAFLIWFFALRDTWESDHRSDVIRLSKDTVDLIQAKNSTNAVSKYEELLRLVGNRKLIDPEITKAVSDARNAAEPVKRTIDAEQAVARIHGMEAQANAFIEAGDFERGIEKYQQALDAIKNTQFDNAELAASVGRISQAKTFASAKLDEKRRDEEAEKKRIEEEKRMAGIKGHIKGGAWLTKKAGNSETLRGLKIFVLRSSGRNEQLLAMLQGVLAGNKERLKDANETVARWEDFGREYPNDPTLPGKKRIAAARKRLVEITEERINLASKTSAISPVDMDSIFSCLPEEPVKEETEVWAAICSQQLAGTVHTDVEGKYTIELPGGHYYLYAEFESAYSEVVWFVPVKIGEPKDIAVDMHNENAVRITNKKD